MQDGSIDLSNNLADVSDWSDAPSSKSRNSNETGDGSDGEHSTDSDHFDDSDRVQSKSPNAVDAFGTFRTNVKRELICTPQASPDSGYCPSPNYSHSLLSPRTSVPVEPWVKATGDLSKPGSASRDVTGEANRSTQMALLNLLLQQRIKMMRAAGHSQLGANRQQQQQHHQHHLASQGLDNSSPYRMNVLNQLALSSLLAMHHRALPGYSDPPTHRISPAYSEPPTATRDKLSPSSAAIYETISFAQRGERNWSPENENTGKTASLRAPLMSPPSVTPPTVIKKKKRKSSSARHVDREGRDRSGTTTMTVDVMTRQDVMSREASREDELGFIRICSGKFKLFLINYILN